MNALPDLIQIFRDYEIKNHQIQIKFEMAQNKSNCFEGLFIYLVQLQIFLNVSLEKKMPLRTSQQS